MANKFFPGFCEAPDISLKNIILIKGKHLKIYKLLDTKTKSGLKLNSYCICTKTRDGWGR
jgi:hypothetical protein